MLARLFRLPAALLLGLLISAPATADNPFENIPDDAGVAVYVPSIDKVVEGVNKFGKAIGVEEMATVAAKDVVENMFEALEGLDTSKPMLVAIGPSGVDSAIMVCWLKDADAWKKSGDVTEKAGVFEFTLEGQQSYAALSGDKLIIAKDRDVLKEAGKSSGKFAGKFDKQIKSIGPDDQFAVIADIEAFRNEIDAGFMTLDAGVKMVLAMAATQNGPESAEMTQAFAKWAMSALKRFVGNADHAMATVSLSAEGVRLRKVVDFKSGEVTDYLAKVKKSDKPLLRGLPERPFMMLFGTEWQMPANTPSLFEDMLEIIKPMMKAEKKENFEQFIAKSKEAYRKSTGLNGMLGGMTGGDKMLLAFNYFTPDPAGYRKLMLEGTEYAQGMMGMMNQGGMKMECKASEEKIDGKDVTAIEYVMNSDVPDVEKMLKAMYGEKPTMYAAEQPGMLAAAFGAEAGSRKLLTSMLDSSMKSVAESGRVKEALAKLAPNPQFVFLMDLGGFMAMVSNMGETMGAGMPDLKLSAPTALVAGSSYLDPGAIRGELWVPADPIKRIIEKASSVTGEQTHPME